VIPAAGAVQDGTPFNEYIMIDLFTADEGLHQYDAAGNGLGGACGVRIYHVNAEMEYRELEHDGQAYPIGTVHVANDFKKHAPGFYLIELIQRGGVNTFTSTNFESNRAVNASDLFRAGDVFTAEAYSQFLADGLMDSGMPFGYTIEILSVSDTEATIRITR